MMTTGFGRPKSFTSFPSSSVEERSFFSLSKRPSSSFSVSDPGSRPFLYLSALRAPNPKARPSASAVPELSPVLGDWPPAPVMSRSVTALSVGLEKDRKSVV